MELGCKLYCIMGHLSGVICLGRCHNFIGKSGNMKDKLTLFRGFNERQLFCGAISSLDTFALKIADNAADTSASVLNIVNRVLITFFNCEI